MESGYSLWPVKCHEMSYSGLWYLLVRTLLEHYGAYQNPMETLHKPYTNPLFFCTPETEVCSDPALECAASK